MLKKTTFLDRDGVINHDSSEYIKNRSEFKFIPGSLEAISQLTLNGFSVIIITNQSVINRKMVSPAGLDRIHNMLRDGVSACGGKILDLFFCPHTETDMCLCRKPKPGLIDMARQKYEIDMDFSVMVGDSAKDIECAKNAGCAKSILVKTGAGAKSEKILRAKNIFPDHVTTDLSEAASLIIRPDFFNGNVGAPSKGSKK